MSKINFKDILQALCCYGVGSTGALVVLILSRSKYDRFAMFHASQSMLFFVFYSFALLVLQKLGIMLPLIYQMLVVFRLTFILYGIYTFVLGKDFRVPYLSDLADKWC